jgi:hypothetical protein
MLSYAALCRHESVFPDLTGMTRAAFDRLAVQFEHEENRQRARSTTTAAGQPRVHAVGAGRPHAHDARTRLLLTLFWRRVYPTYAVLGFFFDLHKRNAQLNVRAGLAILDALTDLPWQRPAADRPKCRQPSEVMTAYPAVRIVIDGKEQPINKPEGDATQKPYYSGKKKVHTLKNQVVVTPTGLICAVSDSVPGGANHDLTVLRASGILEQLAAGEAAMLDKGSVGILNTHPDAAVVIPFKAARNRPLTEEQRATNRTIASHRIVVEHTMAQLNRMTVLRQRFRGQQRERHSQVIRVVAKVVNRRIAERPLKTYQAA